MAQNLADLETQNLHLKPLLNNITKLVNNERKKVRLRANRNNADLAFFHTLSDVGTRKKISEISEILASVDENYQIIMEQILRIAESKPKFLVIMPFTKKQGRGI